MLPEAAPQIAPLIGPETSVVFAMNGIPFWYLYRAETTAPAPRSVAARPRRGAGAHDRARTGHRLHDQLGQRGHRAGGHPQLAGDQNKFTLGEPDGTISRRVQDDLRRRSSAPGSPPPVTQTIRAEIWDKLMRNLSTSPICAMTGEPIGVLGRHPELFDCAEGLMREGLAVAQAHRRRRPT